MERLKPCPRCGTTAYVLFSSIDAVNGGWSAGCSTCYYFDKTINASEKNLYEVHGAYSEEEAVKRWNKRAEYLLLKRMVKKK